MSSRPPPPPPPPQSSPILIRLLNDTEPTSLTISFCLGLLLIYLLLVNLPKPIHSILSYILSAIADIMRISSPEAKERIELLFGNLGSGGGAGIFGRVLGIFTGSGLGFGDYAERDWRKHDGEGSGGDDGEVKEQVAGLWNQGNTCYQNSVLQAMASCKSWRSHLATIAYPPEDHGLDESDSIHAQGDLEPRPVVATLAGLLEALNTSKRILYVPLVIAGSGAGGSSGAWSYNEQQDAQEFFQKLTAAVEKEAAQYWERLKGRRRGLGLGEAIIGLRRLANVANGGDMDRKCERVKDERVLNHAIEAAGRVTGWIKPEELENPFQGLTAQRVGCLRCGYVEEIRLQSFTSLSLSLPSPFDCSLEDCLADYTRIERIEQVNCDKCTLLYHERRLTSLLSPPPPSPSPPPLLRNTLIQRLELVTQAIAEDNFSQEVFDKLSIPRGQRMSVTKTKQTMLARTPKVLALHLNRSQFDINSGAILKNFAGVRVPLWMDIGAVGVVVGGRDWEVDPGKPISAPPENTESWEAGDKGTLYELKGLVAHYGGHQNGHYICYRKNWSWWWKISDEKVAQVAAAEVAAVRNGFMCFYEKVDDERIMKQWEDRRNREREFERLEVTRMIEKGGNGGELGVDLPGKSGGMGHPGVKRVGSVGMGVGGLGLGLAKSTGRTFGSDSDVDAVLKGFGIGGLIKNDVMTLGMWATRETGDKERGEGGVESGEVEDEKRVEEQIVTKREDEVNAESNVNIDEGRTREKSIPIETELRRNAPLTPPASITSPSPSSHSEKEVETELDMELRSAPKVAQTDQLSVSKPKEGEEIPSPQVSLESEGRISTTVPTISLTDETKVVINEDKSVVEAVVVNGVINDGFTKSNDTNHTPIVENKNTNNDVTTTVKPTSPGAKNRMGMGKGKAKGKGKGNNNQGADMALKDAPDAVLVN